MWGPVGLYVVGALLVISNGPATFVDEWVYVSSAEHFADTSQLRVAPASVAPSIFEAFAGGLVLRAFGGGLTALVLISVFLAALAGLALGDILRRAKASPFEASIGVTAFLFAGVFFALSTTYMTDSHAVSLAVVAAALYNRALEGSEPENLFLLGGSLAAALGYLSRPAVLAVVFVVCFLLWIRGNRVAIAWASALPLAAFGGHALYVLSGDTGTATTNLLQQLDVPSIEQAIGIGTTLAVTMGIWLIPFAPAMLSNAQRFRARNSVIYLVVALLLGLGAPLLLGVMPRVGDWLNPDGLFPITQSVYGGRAGTLHRLPLIILMVSAVVLWAQATHILIVRRSVRASRSPAHLALWAFAWSSLAMVLLTVVPRFGVVLDRYVAPFLPALILSITGALAGVWKKRRWHVLPLVLVIAGTVLLSVEGMRVQRAVLDLASSGVEAGIHPTEIDAGAAWVGAQHGFDADPTPRNSSSETWWRTIFAPDIEPRYLVGLNTRMIGCELDRILVEAVFGPSNLIVLIDTQCS